MMLCEYFPPFDQGGSEWSVYHLARQLITDKYIVSILTQNNGGKYREKYRGIEIYRFPFVKLQRYQNFPVAPYLFSNIWWWIKTTWYLYKFIIRTKPTHLHVQGKYFLPAAIIAAKIVGIPVVVTVRDYIILCPHAYCITKERNYRSCTLQEAITLDFPQTLKIRSIRNRWHKFFLLLATLWGWLVSKLLTFFLKQASVTVAISKKLAQIYSANNIPIHQVIYNTAHFYKHPPESNRKKNIILFIGRLTWGKGVDVLISSYARLGKNQTLPPLVVVGEGPLKATLKDKYPEVKFLGRKKHNVIVSLLRVASLVVVPSVWEEPFGRVALEALVNGTPVVSSNRGALPEIVSHKVTGMISTPTPKYLAESIKEALKTELKLRQGIRVQYSKLRQKFEQIPVRQYENIYQNI